MQFAGKKNVLNTQKGFTLIEIIAVLVLLGILAAVAVPKYLDMTNEAKDRGIDAGIAELNSRESLIWGKTKLSSSGWVSDAALVASADYDTDLNTGGSTDYSWTAGPDHTGGTLDFQGVAVALTRTDSTDTSPGYWQR